MAVTFVRQQEEVVALLFVPLEAVVTLVSVPLQELDRFASSKVE